MKHIRIYQTDINFDQFISQKPPAFQKIQTFYTAQEIKDEEMNYHGLKPLDSCSSKGDSASASLRAVFIPCLQRPGFSGTGDKI